MSVSPLENLAVAIERGNARRVEALIHSGSIDVNARLPREFKPPLLVYAAKQMGRHARIRIVQLLLNAGARVDDADENGKTACHMAAWRNDDKVLRVLLAYRPNLAQRDRRGKIAPYTAVLLQYDDVEIALIGAGAPLDGVTLAERCRLAGTSVSAVETLMSRGVVISELRGDFDETPLHYAVMSESCSLALLNKLIACGVDVHALTTNWNQHANTCATLAIHQRNADALCIFLRAGTNVNEELQ